MALFDALFERGRAIALLLFFVLAVGHVAYQEMPKESVPNISSPTIHVAASVSGISTEDAEKSLAIPLETAFSDLEGLQRLASTSREGVVSVDLQFGLNQDTGVVLNRVYEAVNRAEADMPGSTEIYVTEANTDLFPVLSIALFGPVSERLLSNIALSLQEELETVDGVLEVSIDGARSEIIEVLIEPTVLTTYDLTFDELVSAISKNNRIATPGSMGTEAGRFSLSMSAAIEEIEDIIELPIIVRDENSVFLREIAEVRRTFRDATEFVRIDGQPALTLNVSKRSSANILETVEAARRVVESHRAGWPSRVQSDIFFDQSEQVNGMVSDLEANVLAAIIIVMLAVVYALGLRASILVGLAIPGAFLAAITSLHLLGLSLNIVVLFSLILVVGMLVDGAIIVVELADRYLEERANAEIAYKEAAKRMAWPIISSTATTLCVFLPIFFWSGPVGEFMKYLPVTVTVTLTASLVMALFFIPVLGGFIGRKKKRTVQEKFLIFAAEVGDPRDIKGPVRIYVRALLWSLRNRKTTLFIAISVLFCSFLAYAGTGNGITFLPEIESSEIQIRVVSLDDFSLVESDRLVRQVEDKLRKVPQVESVYTRTLSRSDTDVIGIMHVSFEKRSEQYSFEQVIEELRHELARIPGLELQFDTTTGGLSDEAQVLVQVFSKSSEEEMDGISVVLRAMEEIDGFVDVAINKPSSGLEWKLRIDQDAATKSGVDVALLDRALRFLTHGSKVAVIRNSQSGSSVDVIARFPSERRTLSDLESFVVPSAAGLIPISNFASLEVGTRSDVITRVGRSRAVQVSAGLTPDKVLENQVEELRQVLTEANLPASTKIVIAGEVEDRDETQSFLSTAFLASLLLMFFILLAQFNSLRQSLIVLSAILFSVSGVALTYVVLDQPFGLVMGGVGLLALSGIVINNNIVLVDTFNSLQKDGAPAMEAAVRAGVQRLRPVVLTSATTALGLLPMAIGLHIDFASREFFFDTESTQWWGEMSKTIVGGVVFSTFLTLLVTPCLLSLFCNNKARL